MHAVCVGDCDDDGLVTVSELVRRVNVALGLADASTCATDAQRPIGIAELVSAVAHALNGCDN